MELSTATPADRDFDAEREERIVACVSRGVEVLARHPSGLLTDIDGTVSEMASTPDLAIIDQGALAALDALAKRLSLAGVVTGRSVSNALRLTGRPAMLHVGNHGYESMFGLRETFAAGVEPYLPGITEAAEAVRSAQHIDKHLAGAIIENKRFTASFHYRMTDDHAEALEAILRIVEPIAMAAGLTISHGKMVIELRPPLSINKGTAIAGLIAEHQLKGLIFFGDDVTDIDGFGAIRTFDGHADFRGLAVAIVGPDSSPSVAAQADMTIHGVQECAEVLRRLAAAVEKASI